MAIIGKANIIEVLRMQKTPYWRISESVQKREAGNYVATADFENPELGIEDSLDKLRNVLDRLTPGRYILTAFAKNDAKRGGVDTQIEVESSNAIAGIGSTNTPAGEFYLEGIGKVTPGNFETAITAKFKMMQEEERERQRIRDLEAENKRLKAEAAENTSGINKGLLSIGSLLWGQVRNTPLGKEVLGMVSGAAKTINQISPTTATATTPHDNNISGTGTDPQDRIAAALSSMLDGNQEDESKQRELAEQLELLAKVKKENPALLAQGLDFLKSM